MKSASKEFTLPQLPFAMDALQPHMSAETLEYHYHKHHKTYVTKLNQLLADSGHAGASLEEIVRSADGALFNNASQAWNHGFFWNCLKPGGGGLPQGELAAAIDQRWHGFNAFHKAFADSAAANFGAGWTWLVRKPDGGVEIVNTSNAQSPLTTADKPLLTLDVWEHAYYIDYRNARPKFISAFLDSLLNWSFAEANFTG